MTSTSDSQAATGTMTLHNSDSALLSSDDKIFHIQSSALTRDSESLRYLFSQPPTMFWGTSRKSLSVWPIDVDTRSLKAFLPLVHEDVVPACPMSPSETLIGLEMMIMHGMHHTQRFRDILARLIHGKTKVAQTAMDILRFAQLHSSSLSEDMKMEVIKNFLDVPEDVLATLPVPRILRTLVEVQWTVVDDYRLSFASEVTYGDAIDLYVCVNTQDQVPLRFESVLKMFRYFKMVKRAPLLLRYGVEKTDFDQAFELFGEHVLCLGCSDRRCEDFLEVMHERINAEVQLMGQEVGLKRAYRMLFG